jgi:hypothetical protein
MAARFFAALALLLALSPAARAEEAPAPLRYTPPSQTFACDLPGDEWQPFEEEEAAGFAAHILGPDNAAGTYRAGISVRWVEKGQLGWIPLKKRVDILRRGEAESERTATVVRPYRIPAGLSRIFSVVERRRLPGEQLPSMEEELHHYYAVLPVGDSYYEIKLSSTRESYFEYREVFARFLRSFRPLGYSK